MGVIGDPLNPHAVLPAAFSWCGEWLEYSLCVSSGSAACERVIR